MRRATVSASSFLSRSLATVSGGAGAPFVNHRLIQIALYCGSSGGSSGAHIRRFSPFSAGAASLGVVGVVGSIATVGLMSQEVYAKEPPPHELMPKEVVLYQYEACPFCNKVKAFLDYYDIPYKVVEVNPLSKKEIKWSDYKKVPILVVDGEQLVDSSAIIDQLSEKVLPKKTITYASDVDEEKKWCGWVNDHLVHMLSPNIYRNTSEALESFDYITSNGNFSYVEKVSAKYVGAAAMYLVSKKLKKKYSITDERASLYQAAETWVDALNGRDFLGGTKPNLADLAVFGVLRPIRYLRSGKDMVDNTRIGEWYTRMEVVVGKPSRIN